MKCLARWLLFAPLLLGGCDVALHLFAVPVQAQPGSTVTVVIDGGISGTSGYAGCVLQLPNGWTIQNVTNNQNWTVGRDDPGLLAMYTAEPGCYLAAFFGTGTGGFGGGRTLSQITLTLSISIPANALGRYAMKLSLAGGSGPMGAWVIQEPAGIAQFALINAAPYARPIFVGVPVPPDFVLDSIGLPPPQTTSPWKGVAFGDVDGDGRDDLAAVNTTTGPGVHCWLSGPGTIWTEHSTGLPTAVAGNPRLAFGHLDGDGFLDLVDGNGGLYFGNGGTSWQAASLPLLQTPSAYSGIAVGDVDGDGLADVAIGGSGSGPLQVLLNNGNRTFRDASAGFPTSAAGGSAGNLILADLDGDGDRDLVWARWVTPNLWLGDGHGAWTQALGLPPQLTSVAIADLDFDGVPEIVAAVSSSGIQVFKHATGSNWALLPINGLPSIGNYSAIAMFDFDRDGRIDLVGCSADGGGSVTVWRNTASGFVNDDLAGLPSTLLGRVEDLAVGDLDGNTFPDLAIATSAVSSYLGSTNNLRAWQDHCAGVAPFGTGCSGTSTAAPQLVAFGLPLLGNAAFTMQVQEPMPGAIALFWFGGSRTFAAPFALPLDITPFGAPGCTLYASLDYTFFGTVDAGGNYTVALPVPNTPSLAYQTAFSQGAVFAPAANTFGMVFTRAMALRIQ